jgi:acyl-CoA synthetase (AMP-forming)/AMP-acid ligase II/thioesterase domain-containing protein
LDGGGLGSIAELVDRWSRQTPDAIAIAGVSGHGLTYAELGEQLERTRRELRTAGIAAGDRVAVVHPDGPQLASAFLGIAAAAGCAPLNPSYREQELEFSLSDLGAAAIVVPQGAGATGRLVAERLGLGVLELVTIDGGRAELRTIRPVGPEQRPGTDDRMHAALLLHTSGTTARPKLVPLTERNLCASAAAVACALELAPEDRGLAVMPLFHIHGLVASVLAPISAGSTVVCTPGFDPLRFGAWLEDCRPTWYTAVPTMHMAVLDQARLYAARPQGLRLVRSSSAALPMLVADALEDLFAAPVLEAYGMTEAAHQMAANPPPPDERKPGSVGRAAGPEIAVLDQSGEILAAGEIGEVAVRGPSVFAGYERNPEANRESFADGWFRTGDQGYLDEDGYLFLRGRLKEIINRGGEKVSPGEVEEALRAHPGVADTVVFAQPHVRLGETVAAAVVPSTSEAAGAQELRDFAASRLAPFKVPATVVFLDELPKGATGKVQRVGLADRLGLPTLGRDHSARPPYAPPRSELESELCRLWEELLGVERVGIHDDFIALGGDSLVVAQLFAQAAELHGGDDIPASAILAAPTVERLADLLERGRSTSGATLPVDPSRAGTPFFFVPAHDWGTVGLAALGRRLESRHALHTFPLDDELMPEDVTSVEALAPRLVHRLRTTQPHGPYAIGGICFGGGVALEMARLLESDGEEVTLVLVNPIGEHPGRIRHAARSAGCNLRNGSLVRWLRRRGRARVANEGAPPASPSALALERALKTASASYRARPYRGRLTVLAGGDYTTPRRFWNGVAEGGLDWRRVPHGSAAVFRTRHLDALAAELDAVLAEA